MTDVFEDLSVYTPGRTPSPGAVRRYIEQKIFLLSDRGRNYAQKQWAHWLRAHHTPLCARELVEQYGDSVHYESMRHSMVNCDSDRDAGLIAMIIDYLHRPFSLSLDNFQKGFKVKVTSKIETSKFCQMTDMSAVWCENNGVGSIRRTPGSVMTSKPDFGGALEDDEVLKFLSVEHEWLKTMSQPSMGGQAGLANQSYLTILGKATHSGRFGISQNEHFGIGTFNVHPDRDVDTVMLLCLIMTLFAEIHCPDLGPWGLPFAVVFCLDQKCFDNVRKAVALAAKMGKGIFDSIFPTPDHWHATQAAGFASILTGVGWHFFRIYRQAVYLDKHKTGLTADHFSRSMNFTIMYRHLNAIRLGWIRVRVECLAHVATLDSPDPDLETFITWNEYIVPVIYDLLQSVKWSCGGFYEQAALRHFIIVLYLLDRNLYASAFDTYLRDLFRVKREYPAFYIWFMANLNRAVCCLHIEYQHKLLAPFTEHLTERDADDVDPLVCSLPALRDSNTHAESYIGLIKPRTNACSLASRIHDEHHVALWTEAAKTTVRILASTSQRASIGGDTVFSPRFGSFAAKLTRRSGQHFAKRWSREKSVDHDESNLANADDQEADG